MYWLSIRRLYTRVQAPTWALIRFSAVRTYRITSRRATSWPASGNWPDKPSVTRASTPPSAARPMRPTTSIRTRRRAPPTWRCRRPRPGFYARAGGERGHEARAAGAPHGGSDPARVAGRCRRRTRPGGRPSCPVQPERDVRVKRAQRGQITWGGSTSTPRCPLITRCVRSPRRRQARSARALRRRPLPRRDRRRTSHRPRDPRSPSRRPWTRRRVSAHATRVRYMGRSRPCASWPSSSTS